MQHLLQKVWLDWRAVAWVSAQTCLLGVWLARESSKVATDPFLQHVLAPDLFALVHHRGACLEEVMGKNPGKKGGNSTATSSRLPGGVTAEELQQLLLLLPLLRSGSPLLQSCFGTGHEMATGVSGLAVAE